jgi:hypothetical protein
MKVGQTLRARTVYPTYVNDRLALPVGVELVGRIEALDHVAKKKSRTAKLGGDFTPLHTPEIQFERLVFSDGTEAPIQTVMATGGIEVVRFQALSPGAKNPSLLNRLWGEAVGREKATVHTFTAPGKGERLRRAFYAELPYHPELLVEGTQFAVELSAPLEIADSDSTPRRAAPAKQVDSAVTLAAELMDDIDSRNALRGTKVRAVVTEPLLDKEGQVQVPQGAILLGEITQAQPAGKWGKGGVLRLSFRELQFPEGLAQKVHGAPVAVDIDRKVTRLISRRRT